MSTIRRSAFFALFLSGLGLAVLSGCSGGNPHMGKAEDAMKQSQYEQALSRVDSALAQDSTNADAYLLKADIFRRKADSTMSPDAYKRLYERAHAAEEKAQQYGAERDVTKRRRTVYREQVQKGMSAFERGGQTSDPDAYRQAAVYLGAAAATYPDSSSILLNEAYARLNQARLTSDRSMTTVIPVLEQYLERADRPEKGAYDILGSLYMRDDQMQKALDLLETARTDLSERPTHFRIEGTRGLSYSGTVNVGKTSRDVSGETPDRIVLSDESGSVSGTFRKKQEGGQLRVRLFYKGGALRDTIISTGTARLSASLADEKPLAEIEKRLLNAYVQTGQTEKALAAYEDQIEQHPNNLTFRYGYGTTLLKVERYDEAIKQLEKATEMDPGNVKAQYNLGVAYSRKAQRAQKQLVGVMDSLRSIEKEAMAENREPTDAERNLVNRLDQKQKEFMEQKNALFEKSIPPLKRAHRLSDSGESLRENVCRKLVTAYVQINQREEAKQYEDCAGIQIGRRN